MRQDEQVRQVEVYSTQYTYCPLYCPHHCSSPSVSHCMLPVLVGLLPTIFLQSLTRTNRDAVSPMVRAPILQHRGLSYHGYQDTRPLLLPHCTIFPTTLKPTSLRGHLRYIAGNFLFRHLYLALAWLQKLGFVVLIHGWSWFPLN